MEPGPRRSACQFFACHAIMLWFTQSCKELPARVSRRPERLPMRETGTRNLIASTPVPLKTSHYQIAATIALLVTNTMRP